MSRDTQGTKTDAAADGTVGGPDPAAPISAPAKPVPSARADIVLGVVVALGAAALFQQTLDWNPSAAIFPRIVAGVLLLMGAMTIGQGLARMKTAPGGPFLPDTRGFLTVWLAIVAYFFGVVVIGFPAATVLLTMGLAQLFGYRRPLRSAFAGAVFVALTLLVFSGLFNRPLPDGLLLEWLVG